MITMVLGATGATGRLVVQQLINQNRRVKLIVRSSNEFIKYIANDERVEVIYADISTLSDEQLFGHVKGCEAVISCLGHNLTFKGIYGQPRRLVTNVTRRVCEAIKHGKPINPVKYVLMSTTGYQNEAAEETTSLAHQVVISLLRWVLPPHVDNEQAAQFLQNEIGRASECIEWVAVRPDSLVNTIELSQYDIHPSPTSDPIFKARQTSRINVAHFMAQLITMPETWHQWQSKCPVVYNSQH